MSWEIIAGDCCDTLAQMPASSVHTVVTSPPYFGLRDYGTGEWEGGDEACDHIPPSRPRDERPRNGLTGGVATVAAQDGGSLASGRCRCGATRKDRQIGMEPTPDEFVAALVEVFRGVRRVLRDDGTVWLNLGDSYAAGTGGPRTAAGATAQAGNTQRGVAGHGYLRVPDCKPKDLIGIPWLVAFALRADGWYLRSDIIWHKPNPMPESVTDRPTRSHEFIFLLTKNSRYFYDADAIREPYTGGMADWRAKNGRESIGPKWEQMEQDGTHGAGGFSGGMHPAGRNKRDVWTVSTKPYAGAHFATFPPDLIEPCVLAGCPERACSACGAPWERIGEVTKSWREDAYEADQAYGPGSGNRMVRPSNGGMSTSTTQTLGFEPSCECNADPAPGVVLDPFAGAGTTGIVAARNRRSFVGLELNPEYAQMARDRITLDITLGHRAPQRVETPADQLDLLGGMA